MNQSKDIGFSSLLLEGDIIIRLLEDGFWIELYVDAEGNSMFRLLEDLND